jgi:hypothetical protein
LAVLPDDTLDIDIPDQRGAGGQFVDHLLLASMTAMPVTKATREPPVTPVKPIEAVSATIERIWL